MSKLLTGLNKAQEQAVLHKDGPLLIVAGAGTGKTTVIARRIAWLIENQKVDPEKILALTFMDKATEEMEERVNDLLPLGYPDLWINTFHSFGERVLKEVALEVGLNPNFKLLSEPEQWLFIRKHLFEFKLEYYRPLGNPSRFIRALAHHFSRAKDEDITPKQYLKYAGKLEKDFKKTKLQGDEKEALAEEVQKTKELANAYNTYQNLLIEEGFMDFGDLITNTLHVFRTRKSVLNRYRKQFEYILVDEFQDTNYAQYQLVRLLAEPKNNISVVGDDDQSIYKFRGAAVSNILSFKKDYPKAKSVVLTDNYRTTQKILDAAYESISNNNPDRLEKKLKIDKKLKSQRGEGIQPVHLDAETVEQEAALTVKEIIDLKDKSKKSNWKDFAILVRANSHAEPFLKLLAARNIPFQFYAARGLYAKSEVTDLIAYLRVLTDLRDSVSLYRLMSSELFEIPVVDTVRLINLARTRNLSLFEILEGINEVGKISEQGIDEIDRMMHIINEHIELSRKHSVGQLLYKFVEDTGKLKEWLTEADLDSTTRVMNVNQFFKRVLAFEQAVSGTKGVDEKSVRSFVDELNLLMEAGENPAPANPEEGPDAVAVMTIHGSKGLEFPVVFVANLVKERFPGRRRNEELPLPQELIQEDVPLSDAEPHLQEERRLFYVAMTRAREKLYLTTAQDYGGARLKKISPFMDEIAKHLQVKKSKDAKLEIIDSDAKVVVKQKKKLDLPRPSHFSFTQLEAFKTCPRQYQYAHILRIPTLGSHTLSYGRSIHDTLAEFHEAINARDGVVPELEELKEIFERNWQGEWYDSAAHEQKRKKVGWESLQKYYDNNKDTFTPAVFIEQGFNLKIGEYLLRGAIDRADELADGTLEIIDYKTGKVKDQKEVDKNIQLALYALAAKKVFKRDVSKLSLLFLDENKKVSTTRTAEDLEKLETEVLENIEAILKSDYAPTPQYLCNFCDFKGICDEGQQFLK